MQRSDYLGFIGSSAPLYFEDKNSDLLLEVSRSMEQAKTWNARERLLELLKGPLVGEEDANPIMLQGITESDIISVDVYGDTAYVNLSEGFKDACAHLIPKSEMLLVYSIVDTITSMDGISKVQFLIEGKQTETLAGSLCLSNPFIRNYGIIKQMAK
jgi:spore germination protein GerM